MNLPHLLFGLLILMGATLVVLCFIDHTPEEQGFDHPKFPPKTIQQAPEGYERHRSLVAVAGAFGAFAALFTGAALVLGLKPQHRQGAVGRGLLFTAAVYAALLVLVVVVYWKAVDGPPTYLLGFPKSTATMLFVLAPSPLLLVFLYAAFFPRWIMSAEDQQAFRVLVEKRRQQRAD